MSYLVAFANHPIFNIVGLIGLISSAVLTMGLVFGWFIGIVPVMKKLGFGLWSRKIGIFSTQERFVLLKNCFTDSSIFKESNIISLSPSDVERSKEQSLILVDWQSCENEIEKILSHRASCRIPVIIYAAPSSIPHDKMADIANRPYTIVVNFRGRLLNDVLTSLMLT